MQREEVGVVDAVFAILLLELTSSSEQEGPQGGGWGGGLLGPTENLLHNSFPDDPNAYYLAFCQSILCGLGLDDIWQQVEAEQQ